MAYIRKLNDKRRSKPWRAQVRRKGLYGIRALVKMFESKKLAERWAREQERQIDRTGLPPTFEDLKKHTVGDLVWRYLAEVTPTKGSRVSESAVLKAFLRPGAAS